jgi:hypothetical protein
VSTQAAQWPKTPAPQFCLIAAPLLNRPAWRYAPSTASSSGNGTPVPPSAVGTYEAFAVPGGTSYLTSHPDGRPCFATDAIAPPEAASLVVEPLRLGAEWRLVVARPASHPLRVNGLRAPRVQVLQVGDQLQIHPGFVLHVTLYREPQIVPQL